MLRKIALFTLILSCTCLVIYFLSSFSVLFVPSPNVLTSHSENTGDYWLVLHRASNREDLYRGKPGKASESTLIKSFKVKTGIPGEKPTPLPQLLGRDYWVITDKFDVTGSEELAPYFLKLDVPYSTGYPFGPTPYLECNGQCNWELPGSFGLHGVAGDNQKLSEENRGSSGCIRHNNEDIEYLYNLLDPKNTEVRYYIEDN